MSLTSDEESGLLMIPPRRWMFSKAAFKPCAESCSHDLCHGVAASTGGQFDRDASLPIDYHDLTRDHPSTLPTHPYKKRLGQCLIVVPCTVGHGLDRAFLSEKRYQPDARIRLAYLFSPPAIPGVKEPCRHIASPKSVSIRCKASDVIIQKKGLLAPLHPSVFIDGIDY